MNRQFIPERKLSIAPTRSTTSFSRPSPLAASFTSSSDVQSQHDHTTSTHHGHSFEHISLFPPERKNVTGLPDKLKAGNTFPLSPSSSPNAVQLTAVVQRYTHVGTRKTSQASDYITDSAHDDLLYVEPHAAPPQPTNLIVATGNNTAFNGVNYTQYHYNPARNFVNDCLSFAENIARGTDVDSRRAEFRAEGDRPGGTDRLFGQSDSQNTDIAQGSAVRDEQADPDIGSAYAIVRSVLPAVGETPYHIATVVAKDDPDNVTLEADASDQGRLRPLFDMYTTLPTPPRRGRRRTLSFHDTYEPSYKSKRGRTTSAPSTVVLNARDD